MKQLRYRLAAEARAKAVPRDVVEKDYLISYVLAGIAADSGIGESLVLKGGTALRKLHFRDYRFSEDLDFSTVGPVRGESLEAGVRASVERATALLAQYGPFGVDMRRYEERDPHPHGQESFVVRARFPWQPEPLCRIKIEVTTDEPILLPPEQRQLLHGYDEDLQCTITCYSLEEIAAEKLRTLLQTHQKLATRGWNRPRARDYYDLWRIFRDRKDVLRTDGLPEVLRLKAAHRGVSWQSVDDFFTAELVGEAVRTWEQSLGPFVGDLQPCELVLRELMDRLADVLP